MGKVGSLGGLGLRLRARESESAAERSTDAASAGDAMLTGSPSELEPKSYAQGLKCNDVHDTTSYDIRPADFTKILNHFYKLASHQ
jgi:hypothetical protein